MSSTITPDVTTSLNVLREDLTALFSEFGVSEDNATRSTILTHLSQVMEECEVLREQASTANRTSDSLTTLANKVESLSGEVSTLATTVKNRSLSPAEVERIQKSALDIQNAATGLAELYDFDASDYLTVVRELSEYGQDRVSWISRHGSISDYLKRVQEKYRFRGLVGLDITYQVQLMETLDTLSNLNVLRDQFVGTVDQSSTAVKSLAAAALNVEQRYTAALVEAAGLNEQIKNGAQLAKLLSDLLARIDKALPVLESSSAILEQRIPVDTQTKDALRAMADTAPQLTRALVRLTDHVSDMLPLYDAKVIAQTSHEVVASVDVVASMGSANKAQPSANGGRL